MRNETGRKRRRGTGGDPEGAEETRGADSPRHATFGFIVVYPVTVRFPRFSEILRQLIIRARSRNKPIAR